MILGLKWEPNNFVMHPANYNFGAGQRSPEHIAFMLAQANGPVYIAGPTFGVPTQVAT